MRIYLIRHGDPNYDTDSLTSIGRTEALALSEYMDTHGLDAIYSSPLGRARETARYTEERTGLKAVIEDWTAEIKIMANDNSGLMAWDMRPSLLRAIDGHGPEQWRGECERIARDSDDWFLQLGWERRGAQYYRHTLLNSHGQSQIALFCHGGFGLTWLAHLLQIPIGIMWSSFFLHTTSVTTLLLEEREDAIATIRVLSMSSLPHLYKEGLQPSRAGIKANFH